MAEQNSNADDLQEATGSIESNLPPRYIGDVVADLNRQVNTEQSAGNEDLTSERTQELTTAQSILATYVTTGRLSDEAIERAHSLVTHQPPPPITRARPVTPAEPLESPDLPSLDRETREAETPSEPELAAKPDVTAQEVAQVAAEVAKTITPLLTQPTQASDRSDPQQPGPQPQPPARETARPSTDPVAPPPTTPPRPDGWMELFQGNRQQQVGPIRAAIAASLEYADQRIDRALGRSTPSNQPPAQESAVPSGRETANQDAADPVVRRATELDREASRAGGTTPPPHPLVAAAHRALQDDQDLAARNLQQFRAAQASDQGLAPGLQTPEAYYAASQLGYRPGDHRAKTAAGRRDRSDDPGRTWADLGPTAPEERERSATSLDQARELLASGPSPDTPPHLDALAQELRRNPDLTPADARVIQQRQAHGAPVSSVAQSGYQRSWGQQMLTASRDALQQMPIVGRLFYQMEQMQNAMAKAAPLLAERHPALANALFGEATASGIAGAPLGGIAGAATGAAGTILAGMLATRYASYKGQQAAQLGANATSPFIGNTNAEIMGDMGQSAARALTGTSTELIMLPRRIHDWSQALLDSNFTLKEWSADIAKLAFQSEIREIIRGQRSGAATAQSLEDLSNETQNMLDFWRPTKDRITNFIAEKLTNAERKLRGLTDEEKAVLESPGFDELWRRQKDSLTWKERTLGLSEERKSQLAKEQLDYVREHAETPADTSYRGMENWMRMWQDGRMMQHQSQRPTPKGN